MSEQYFESDHGYQGYNPDDFVGSETPDSTGDPQEYQPGVATSLTPEEYRPADVDHSSCQPWETVSFDFRHPTSHGSVINASYTPESE